jgi:hypothetical protein
LRGRGFGCASGENQREHHAQGKRVSFHHIENALARHRGWLFKEKKRDAGWRARETMAGAPIRAADLIRFFCTMKMNLIALTVLGLAAVLFAGCAATTETTTTTRTREQSSLYAR